MPSQWTTANLYALPARCHHTARKSALLALCLALFSGICHADNVIYGFSGVFGTRGTGVFASIGAGTPFTGTLEYDPSAVGQMDQFRLVYDYIPAGMNGVTLDVPSSGISIFAAATAQVVTYRFCTNGGCRTGLSVSSFNPVARGLGTAGVSSLAVELMNLGLNPPSFGVTLPLSLSLAELPVAVVTVYDGRRSQSIQGTITSLTPAPVPEPSTALTLALGICVLVFRRERMRRQ